MKKGAELAKTKAYIVGGFPRDLVLSRKPADIDVIVPQAFLDRFVSIISDLLSIKAVLMGREKEPIYVFFLPDGMHIDISAMRYGHVEEDLRRRDFTMNSIAIEIGNWKFIDVTGGMEDIKVHLVRAPSKDVFVADPLRVLRAYRLAAEIGFKIDENTKRWIKEVADNLKCVAKERVRDEIFRLLSTFVSGKYIAQMYEDGVLQHVFPIVKYMEGVGQGKYHHLDLLQHSLECLNILEKILIEMPAPFADYRVKDYLRESGSTGRNRAQLLKFAALFHDIGKPFTMMVDGEEVHFYRHQVVGADIIRNIAIDIKLSKKESEFLRKLVYWHMFPIFLIKVYKKGEDYSRHLPRFLMKVRKDVIALFLLSYADLLSSRGGASDPGDADRLLVIADNAIKYYFKRLAISIQRPLLNGFDIMSVLGIKPGPLVGRIKQELLEMEINGIIKSKEEAIEWLRNRLRKGGGLS